MNRKFPLLCGDLSPVCGRSELCSLISNELISAVLLIRIFSCVLFHRGVARTLLNEMSRISSMAYKSRTSPAVGDTDQNRSRSSSRLFDRLQSGKSNISARRVHISSPISAKNRMMFKMSGN